MQGRTVGGCTVQRGVSWVCEARTELVVRDIRTVREVRADGGTRRIGRGPRLLRTTEAGVEQISYREVYRNLRCEIIANRDVPNHDIRVVVRSDRVKRSRLRIRNEQQTAWRRALTNQRRVRALVGAGAG